VEFFVEPSAKWEIAMPSNYQRGFNAGYKKGLQEGLRRALNSPNYERGFQFGIFFGAGMAIELLAIVLLARG
jgi:hypothetical protein